MPVYPLMLTYQPPIARALELGAHVPFYLASQIASDAWAAAMATTCADVLVPSDLGVVHVTSEFRRELFVGEAIFDVTLDGIGISSITFVVRISQAGAPAATLTFVLSRVNELRTHSIPLSPPQRAALERLLAA